MLKRWLFCFVRAGRIVVNFTSAGIPRWNVGNVNINGDELIPLNKGRNMAPARSTQKYGSMFKGYICIKD